MTLISYNAIIGTAMTELYLLTTEDVRRLPENYFREHFPLRLERSGKYRFEEDRLRCLGAGVLLWEILRIRENELKTGPCGKPFLPGDARGFNLSHSGGYIVLAVSDAEVGVDIEKINERHTDVAQRVYQPAEIAWMNEAAGTAEEPCGEKTRRFFRLWTLKESVMKTGGRGFSLPPESFSVLPAFGNKEINVSGTGYYARYSDAVPGYILAVCGRSDTKPDLYRMELKDNTFLKRPCQF